MSRRYAPVKLVYTSAAFNTLMAMIDFDIQNSKTRTPLSTFLEAPNSLKNEIIKHVQYLEDNGGEYASVSLTAEEASRLIDILAAHAYNGMKQDEPVKDYFSMIFKSDATTKPFDESLYNAIIDAYNERLSQRNCNNITTLTEKHKSKIREWATWNITVKDALIAYDISLSKTGRFSISCASVILRQYATRSLAMLDEKGA